MRIINLPQTVVLELTVGCCERLKASDLLDVNELPADPSGFISLHDDPSRLAKVAWEMSDKRVSIERFAELLTGDAREAVYDAVCAAIIEFFREPMRAIVAALIEKIGERRAAMAVNMMKVINGVPPEHGAPSGSLQEFAESIPEPSLFVSSTTWPEVDREATGEEIHA